MQNCYCICNCVIVWIEYLFLEKQKENKRQTHTNSIFVITDEIYIYISSVLTKILFCRLFVEGANNILNPR